VQADTSLRLQVTGAGGIPATATAVTMNVTITGPDAGGYLTVYPCDQPVPDASNLNFVTGQDVPNLVTVKLAADGSVCLRPSARTHVVADVGMWFGTGGTDGFYHVSPERVLDTRDLRPAGPRPGRPGPNSSPELKFGSPLTDGLTDIHAVVMNTTVTGSAAAGYLTVFPCDRPQPDASNLNFLAGQDVPNLVAVKVSAANSVCIASPVHTNVIVDVAGFFSSMTIDVWGDVLVTE
jgi:hypothetical protein